MVCFFKNGVFFNVNGILLCFVFFEFYFFCVYNDVYFVFVVIDYRGWDYINVCFDIFGEFFIFEFYLFFVGEMLKKIVVIYVKVWVFWFSFDWGFFYNFKICC